MSDKSRSAKSVSRSRSRSRVRKNQVFVTRISRRTNS